MTQQSQGEYTVRGRVGPGDSFQYIAKVLAWDFEDALRKLYVDIREMRNYKNFLVTPAGGNPRLFTLDERPHFYEL